MPRPSWHALPNDVALAEQKTDSAGLCAAEATRRLAQHGPNQLTPPQKRGPLLRFLLQFHNVLIYVLLGAAGVTALLGHSVDTAVILGVVVINALIGFIQEGKAEKSLDAIRNMLSLHAMVMRDGRRQEIDADRSGTRRYRAARFRRQGAGRSATVRDAQPAHRGSRPDRRIRAGREVAGAGGG